MYESKTKGFQVIVRDMRKMLDLACVTDPQSDRRTISTAEIATIFEQVDDQERVHEPLAMAVFELILETKATITFGPTGRQDGNA